jgi:hypothetical protein
MPPSGTIFRVSSFMFVSVVPLVVAGPRAAAVAGARARDLS